MSKVTTLALVFAIICTWTVTSIQANRNLQGREVRTLSQIDTQDLMSNARQLPVQPETSHF